MCVKHQYSTRSEYGSMSYYTFEQKKYKCLVITERDLILHRYYSTRAAKVKFYNTQKIGGSSRAEGWESSEQVKKAARLEGSTVGPTAPRGRPDLLQWGSPQSKLRSLDKQIQGYQKAT